MAGMGRRRVSVTIMVPYPGHGEGKLVFVAAVWRHIEKVVSSEERFETPRVGRVRVEDRSRRILIEDARAWRFVRGKRVQAEVVIDVAFRHLVLCERDVIVLVEAVAIRRNPRTIPPHAVAEGFDLFDWRA